MKTVIITGASRGIGRAAAELFARHDYHVVLNYLASRQAALDVCAALRRDGCSVLPFQADVTRAAEVNAMVNFCISEFGGVDLLINNAGIAQTALFTEISESDWDAMIAVNLKGVYLCAQAVLSRMIPQKKGKIINIASIWGLVGSACEVHYSAAKAGVIGLTKALAKEVGPSNIQVNCIAPGVIDTDMLAGYSKEEKETLEDQTPLQRLGKPAEIAACALFLASDQADFITGQIISPNGGFVI